MRIKICGITNYEDAKLCCDCGADALGFIFYEKSKRFVSIDEAKSIIQKLPAFVSKIGVFINEDSKKINDIAREIKLTGVQLHGEETPEFAESILLPVIKGFRVSEEFDFSITDKYPGCKFLLDTYSTKEYGGTGQTFDWEIIPMKIRKTIILAGGVSSSNIEHIFKTVKPVAVDVSSSLEIKPGIKDESKVKSFFEIFNSLRR
ncbi:MAG: phosphoribosylanthranilate isomerase [bacterium]